MKTLKLAIAAVILAFSVQAASAQVRLGVNIGTPPPPPRHVVVVRPPVHREVIVRHAPPRRVYYKPVHRKVVYHPAYRQNVRVVRHY
jgi:hypothetical protein